MLLHEFYRENNKMVGQSLGGGWRWRVYNIVSKMVTNFEDMRISFNMEDHHLITRGEHQYL